MAIDLDTPVQQVSGIGPKRAEMLHNAGIYRVEDLLTYPPFRYEDRTIFKAIRCVEPGFPALIKATVSKAGRVAVRRRGFSRVDVFLRDESGLIKSQFFNQPYLARIFPSGREVILFGIPRVDSQGDVLSLVNPEFELVSCQDESVHTGRIVPVYRRLDKLTTRSLRKLIFQLLSQLPDELPDPLPANLRQKHHLPGLVESYRSIHFPEVPAGGERVDFLSDLDQSLTPAQRRLIFEEFFQFQLGVLLVRERNRREPKNRRITVDDGVRERIRQILPFHPTLPQKKAVREIVEDLCGPRVMRRLLQGDVGSGKTIVAVQAIVVVVESGYQAVLMAPTELLAEQHFRSLSQLLREQPYRLALLTRSVRGEKRRRLLALTESGEIDVVVGTHALIEDGVSFRSLALVVVDEQHRFGVVQRSKLIEKGSRPDLLVMSATPIPRSLALTAFADLDVSIIDRLPPGRKEVRTIVRTEDRRDEVYSLLKGQLELGRQVYVVYPVIEGVRKLDLRGAKKMARELADVFSNHRVGLMHGRLPAKSKETLLTDFVAGEIEVLVSTTVIEVGIDVPNAAAMVIEHAGRFGLSQLHQLRGRIGRGKFPGLCVLMADNASTEEGRRRMKAMRETNDGFRIAEMDLEIRGPGDFFGTRQSGIPEFRFGDLVRDRALLLLARNEAGSYLQQFLASGVLKGELESAAAAEKWKGRLASFHTG